MLIRPAEEAFRQGLEALAKGHRIEALAGFEAAVEIERRLGIQAPQARYLSYYGLCVAFEGSRREEAVLLCVEALGRESYNPDLCWNLGRVLLLAGRRQEAHAAFLRGLDLEPGHAGIERELSRMGRRRRPILQFLDRGNPLNVLLGKLTVPNGSERQAGRPQTAPAQPLPSSSRTIRRTSRMSNGFERKPPLWDE